jgi:hypothetical protein
VWRHSASKMERDWGGGEGGRFIESKAMKEKRLLDYFFLFLLRTHFIAKESKKKITERKRGNPIYDVVFLLHKYIY